MCTPDVNCAGDHKKSSAATDDGIDYEGNERQFAKACRDGDRLVRNRAERADEYCPRLVYMVAMYNFLERCL